MRRLTLSAILLALFFVSAGCSKESNVVAPSGSEITVTALPSTNISAGTPVTVTAFVVDSNGNDMNGVGVRFTSSNPSVASFSSTAPLGQISEDTNDRGVATVTVYAISAGSADITADIERASGSVSLTVQ